MTTRKSKKRPNHRLRKVKRPVGRPPKEPVVREADPPFWTIEEFCALFDHTRKIWPKYRPYLKTVQLGVRTYIPRAEVHRFVESLERPAEKTGAPEGATPPAAPAPRAAPPSR
jgi:hypothetical protein